MTSWNTLGPMDLAPRVSLPSVGRTVHYVSYGTPNGEYTSKCRAAIVTGAKQNDSGLWVVSLAVLNPEGMFFNQDLSWADASKKIGGTWHWPEFVDMEIIYEISTRN